MAPELVTLRVHADRDAVLVANDSYYPGWTARIDGLPASVLKANGHVRAVPVRAGDHIVSMQFESARVRWGCWIAVALAAAVMSAAGAIAYGGRAA